MFYIVLLALVLGHTLALLSVAETSKLFLGQHPISNLEWIDGKSARRLGGPLDIYIQTRKIRYHCVGGL